MSKDPIAREIVWHALHLAGECGVPLLQTTALLNEPGPACNPLAGPSPRHRPAKMSRLGLAKGCGLSWPTKRARGFDRGERVWAGQPGRWGSRSWLDLDPDGKKKKIVTDGMWTSIRKLGSPRTCRVISRESGHGWKASNFANTAACSHHILLRLTLERRDSCHQGGGKLGSIVSL